MLSGALARIDPEFARELAPRFTDFDRLPAELRGPVAISYAIANGEAALDPLIARMGSTIKESERAQMAEALGAFPDPRLIRQVLEQVATSRMTPSGVLNLLGGIVANPVGGRALYDWYRSHSKSVSEMWAGTPLLSLALRLGMVAMGIDQEQTVEEYFREHTPPEAASGVMQGLEALRLAARLRRGVRGSDPS
jgi:aminopeptidase N